MRKLDHTYQAEAKGHDAIIFKFDNKTVLVPFNAIELDRLISLVLHLKHKLEASKDFPEKEEYENLYSNLASALYLIEKS